MGLLALVTIFFVPTNARFHKAPSPVFQYCGCLNLLLFKWQVVEDVEEYLIVDFPHDLDRHIEWFLELKALWNWSNWLIAVLIISYWFLGDSWIQRYLCGNLLVASLAIDRLVSSTLFFLRLIWYNQIWRMTLAVLRVRGPTLVKAFTEYRMIRKRTN